MKNGKILNLTILTLVVNLCVISYAKAQSINNLKNSTPVQRAQFQTNMMKNKLKLDSTQVIKTQVINLKYAQKFQPVLKGNVDVMTKINQLMDLQQQKDNELQQVFTKGQFKQYQTFEQDLKGKIMARLNN